MLAGALVLFADVQQHGVVSYAIGSWPPPWGIEYRLDAANAFLLLLLGIIATAVAPFAWTSVAAEVPRDQHYLFYALHCLCLAGLAGITVTGDAFNIFVFLEISSLSTYVLIALGRDRRALLAAYQYLILGTIGATFFVIGIGLLYLETGTLNLADLAQRLADVRGKRSVLAALAFITVGISLKLALFPLHMWLPNAYAYAPVRGFLAARRRRDQGLGVRAAAVLLLHLRRRRRLRSAAHGGPAARALGRRHVRGLRRRDLAGQSQAHAGVLERRPDRLHHVRHRPRLADGGHRQRRAHLQPRHHQGGALPARRLHRVAAGQRALRPHGRDRPVDALDLRRHRRRRLEPHRRAGDGGIRQQVVPGACGRRNAPLVDRDSAGGKLAARGGLRVAIRRDRLVPGTSDAVPVAPRGAGRDARAGVGARGGDRLVRRGQRLARRGRDARPPRRCSEECDERRDLPFSPRWPSRCSVPC